MKKDKPMTTHVMGLFDEPFESIKYKRKNVEVRLNDEKRRQIKIGDTIVFQKVFNPHETLEVKVIDLRVFNTFEEMYSSIPFSDFDCSDWIMEDMLRETYEIYSKEQEKEWGTLAIRIELE